jgi:hypothetical protein
MRIGVCVYFNYLRSHKNYEGIINVRHVIPLSRLKYLLAALDCTVANCSADCLDARRAWGPYFIQYGLVRTFTNLGPLIVSYFVQYGLFKQQGSFENRAFISFILYGSVRAFTNLGHLIVSYFVQYGLFKK